MPDPNSKHNRPSGPANTSRYTMQRSCLWAGVLLVITASVIRAAAGGGGHLIGLWGLAILLILVSFSDPHEDNRA